MRTSSRNLAVALFDEVEILDVAAPLQVFTVVGRPWNWRPFRVHLVADRPRSVETRNQTTLAADTGFDDCPAPEVIVVPGGYGARPESPLLEAWLRRWGPEAEAIVGVGNGVLPLARAGLCAGAAVAPSPDVRDAVAQAAPDAILDGRRVVRAGRLVTAATSAASLDAALVVVGALFGDKQAVATARALDHPWAPQDGAPAPLRIEITSGGERK